MYCINYVFIIVIELEFVFREGEFKDVRLVKSCSLMYVVFLVFFGV